MGFFGTYLYDGTSWRNRQLSELVPAVPEPWLLVDIHDSDITTLMYRPAGPGSGTAYLGVTPRTYFESDDASAPTDVAREAAGLSAWWALLNPDKGDADAKATELAGYLAEDLRDDELEDDEVDDDELVDESELIDDYGANLDAAEIFVEIKTALLLTALDLPLPDDLIA